MCVHGRVLRCLRACVRAWRGVSAADAVGLWGAQHELRSDSCNFAKRTGRGRAGLGPAGAEGVKNIPEAGRGGWKWGGRAGAVLQPGGLRQTSRGVGCSGPFPTRSSSLGPADTSGTGLGCEGEDGKVWGILTFPWDKAGPSGC